jgi:hypothetical protein
MQTLELEKYGAIELNDAEMIGIDGGDIWDQVVKILGYTMAGLAIVALVSGLIITLSSSGGGGGGDGGNPTRPGIL